jgi:hypothetical protein
MLRFFAEGNYWFMGTLSILFLIILSLTVMAVVSLKRSTPGSTVRAENLLGHIRSVALFTLVIALFFQILGLVDIFDYLANKDSQLAASILAKGIKITFWPTLYGTGIFLLSMLISTGLKVWAATDN